jgi:hypothetical protein
MSFITHRCMSNRDNALRLDNRDSTLRGCSECPMFLPLPFSLPLPALPSIAFMLASASLLNAFCSRALISWQLHITFTWTSRPRRTRRSRVTLSACPPRSAGSRITIIPGSVHAVQEVVILIYFWTLHIKKINIINRAHQYMNNGLFR